LLATISEGVDFETVYNFGKSGCIEIELVNLDALLKLEKGLKVILHLRRYN
jgi:hypothetical protein